MRRKVALIGDTFTLAKIVATTWNVYDQLRWAFFDSCRYARRRTSSTQAESRKPATFWMMTMLMIMMRIAGEDLRGSSGGLRHGPCSSD